jgi:hypothetical protein
MDGFDRSLDGTVHGWPEWMENGLCDRKIINTQQHNIHLGVNVTYIYHNTIGATQVEEIPFRRRVLPPYVRPPPYETYSLTNLFPPHTYGRGGGSSCGCQAAWVGGQQ